MTGTPGRDVQAPGAEAHDDAPRPGWRPLRHYAYLARSYEAVWPVVAADPHGVLGAAGSGAAGTGLADLHVRRGGVDMNREVRLGFGGLVADPDVARMPVRVEDAARPALFPVFEGELSLEPLTVGSRLITQVGLSGRYRPPLGALGGVGDRLLGPEVAAASVAEFVDAIARRLEGMVAAEAGDPESRRSQSLPVEPGQSRILVMLDGLGGREGGAAAVVRLLAGTTGVVRAEVDPLAGIAEIVFDPGRCRLHQLLEDLDVPVPPEAEPASPG